MTALNEEQSKAVLSPATRKLVVAGPGSGKTRTLCAAVADAVGRGRKPESIVVVTYTNAAAAEVEQRLRDECGLAGRLGFCGTLHAFCLRLVRGHAEALGLPSRLSVVDDDQREGLLESVREEMGLKCSARKALELLAASKGTDPVGGIPTKETLLVREYHRRLASAGLLDVDQILHYGLLAVRNSVGDWPYECLFVDEFQDAADQDAEIYRDAPFEEKFWVGDPDQAIYGFRGGNVKHIVNRADLSGTEGTEVFWLQLNYRSGSVVCEHAQRMVENNAQRLCKRTEAVRKGGTVEAHRCETPADELGYVLEEVRRLNAHNDIAVLARTNRLVDAVATHLAANGVPVRRAQEQAEPADWRRTKLLLTVLGDPYKDMAVLELLRLDAGKEAAAAAKRDAAVLMLCVSEAIGWRYGKGGDLPALASYGVSPESMARVRAAVHELEARGPSTIPDLLLYMAATEDARQEEGEGVTCATIHSAKGREWRHVFVVGCEEGVLPSGKAGTPEQVEEERRLMYVAMTRAAETLTLTWCASRPQWRGANMPPGPPQAKEPSRFLKEAGL